ncbi:MAG: phosphatase PAP2 family protein [Gammaproteobacteria bacterium]|nr:phosphatase PAP2 family protein [Gammaproteobacteria bacterium]MDE0270457.1 phosphatase PAP2 family protein [Gammaproteobacteria bacterium]
MRPILVRLMGFAVLAALAGCASSPPRLGEAALAAAKSPRTWVPLAGAAVLSVGDLDDSLSDWAADERPLFGGRAAAVSDDLRNAAVAGFFVTALATPADKGRWQRIGWGLTALYAQGGVVEGLKDVVGRQRPDGSGDRSFPSGHAGVASSAATLGQRNLCASAIAPRWRRTASLSFDALALGAGWARMEAEKHHAADVLAGYAIGHFITAFVAEAFIEPGLPAAELSFQGFGNGGALRLTVPLRPGR